MDDSSMHSKTDSHKFHPLDKLKQKSLQQEFTSLAVKTITIAIGVWLILYVFELFEAPAIGLKHNHIQIVGTVITITIAFTTITAIRRILHKFLHMMPPQFSASLSFFIITFISLITAIALLYQWDINPQEILVGGGVAAVVVGIGVSTIVGNIFSGGLMLTTFPAKIGDSIFVVNDKVRGTVEEINMIYTKIKTDQDTEYIVTNSAIIQGTVRIIKEDSLLEQIPFTDGDRIELTSPLGKYSGTVIKMTPRFTTIRDENKRETIIANSVILDDQCIITKMR